MAKERIEKQMSESFIIGSLLAVTGGYFDAYTYISRGGVFANAQTGNIVLFGINLAHGDYIKMLSYMIPVIAFVLGIFTAEFIRQYEKKMHIHWRQVIIALEILAVVIVAFLPVSEKNMYTYNMSANVIISFVCSLQVQSFRRISGIVCATTMCTGNLRSGAEALEKYRVLKDKKYLHNAVKYFGIDLFFVVGAVISTLITPQMMEKSVILCSAVLLGVFGLLFVSPKAKIKKE